LLKTKDNNATIDTANKERESNMNVEPIAKIYNGYCDKFGIPRQSGLVGSAVSYIVFEKKFRVSDALRGIEGYSHLWLLWQFSQSPQGEEFSPTVRPPRLGGNKRVGVFATRSPNRPNSIGLSSVKLGGIIHSKEHGDVLQVYGADILSGTPIIDIKPYVPYADSHPDAVGGFADEFASYALSVVFEGSSKDAVDASDLDVLCDILKNDPRPSYQDDAERVYTLDYAKYKVRFRVDGKVLFVVGIDICEREVFDI